MNLIKIRLKKIICMAFVCLLCTSICTPVYAASQSRSAARTIRVAFPRQEGFVEISTDGNYSGYTFEYLEKVAEYTGWEIEYITFDEMDLNESILAAMDMVASGEADIIGGLLKNETLTERYDFCDNSYGLVYTTLAARENNTSVSEDNFRQISPLRVAVYDKANTRNAELEDYLKKEGVVYELVPCASVQEQMDALENGTADVVNNVSLSNYSGTKIIASFAARPYYFAATKGNTELVSELDQALCEISYAFPYFQKQLQSKYFEQGTGVFTLTGDQVNMLADKQTLQVLCVDESAPFVMQDEKGQPCGVLVSLMDAFAKETGIAIQYDIYDRSLLFTEQLSKKDYDCILGIPVNQNYATKYGFIRSMPLDTVDMVTFYRPALGKPLSECTIALVEESDYAKNMECKEVIYASTVEECIRLVNEKKADLGFDNRATVDYYIYDIYANLVTDLRAGHSADICVTVSDRSGNELLAILNSYIGSVGEDVLEEYYAEASIHNQKNTVELLARSNPLLSMSLVSVFIIALFAAVLFGIASSRKKKQYALLVKANAAKSDFLSRMSHDMRTPMNAIIGFAHIGIESHDPDESAECLQKIKASGHYLEGLINDVLDMSKIEEGKLELHPEPYYYTEFEETIRTILMQKAQQKGVMFVMRNSVKVHSAVALDKLRTQQVFVNLIGNAIKFTPRGGRVEFSVTAQAAEPDGTLPLTFIVRDNGIGMSEEFQKSKLFHSFEQEHNSVLQVEAGTGLGLSIAKQLVNQMGGSIECQSELGKGTAFTVKLYPKVVQGQTNKTKQSEEIYDILRGRRILLCEDHPMNAQIATYLLHEQHMEVVVAENGKCGVEFLQNHEPGYFDAILMDIQMPVMDGLAATRAIRTIPRPDAGTIPIIAMTANAYDDDVKRCIDAGMNAHLAKPVEPQKLYQTLAEQIDSHEPM